MAKTELKKTELKKFGKGLTKKQQAIGERIFRRIDIILFSAQMGYVKLSSAANLLEKSVNWLRQLDSAPDEAIFTKLIMELENKSAKNKSATEAEPAK